LAEKRYTRREDERQKCKLTGIIITRTDRQTIINDKKVRFVAGQADRADMKLQRRKGQVGG
jgi:hypothetical protein